MGIVPLLRNILFPPPAANSPYALKVNSTVNYFFSFPQVQLEIKSVFIDSQRLNYMDLLACDYSSDRY